LDFATGSQLVIHGARTAFSQVFSIEFFCAPTSLTGTQIIIDAPGHNGLNAVLRLEIREPGCLHLYGRSGSGTGAWNALTYGPAYITAGVANHVVVTYDPLDEGIARAFVNGAKVFEGPATLIHSVGAMLHVSVGARWDRLNTYTGKFGELAFYGYALSEERVAAHYAAAA
jgi:hypothetical protein